MDICTTESQSYRPTRQFGSFALCLRNNKYIPYWQLCKIPYSNTRMLITASVIPCVSCYACVSVVVICSKSIDYQSHPEDFLRRTGCVYHHGEWHSVCVYKQQTLSGWRWAARMPKRLKKIKKTTKNEKHKTKLWGSGGEQSEETEKLRGPATTHTPHDLCQSLLRPLSIRSVGSGRPNHALYTLITTYSLTE
jgi:hypothetical protein